MRGIPGTGTRRRVSGQPTPSRVPRRRRRRRGSTQMLRRRRLTARAAASTRTRRQVRENGRRERDTGKEGLIQQASREFDVLFEERIKQPPEQRAAAKQDD